MRPPRLKLPRPMRRPPPVSEPGTQPDPELHMSFFAHLDELRSRLLKIILALIVGFIIGTIIASPVLAYLIKPYADLFPEEGRELVVLGPTGAIVAYFRVALLVGGIFSVPTITYQLLMFVLPGLTRRERRMLLGALIPIMILFLVGVAFSWFILIPPAIGFLEGFQPELFRPEWTADNYLSFVTALLFWMGVAFETPLVFFILSLLGVVGAGGLIKNWRSAIVGAAIAAAFITPTADPVNMFLVMGPLMALYLLSIILVAIGRRISTPK